MARRIVIYLTTHNNQKETDINAPSGIRTGNPATEWQQAHVYTARLMGSDNKNPV